MQKPARVVVVTVVLATALGFAAHVLIQGWEDEVSARYAHLLDPARAKEKFDPVVILVAGLTALSPTALAYMLLSALWDRLPGRHWWQKGLVFGALLLMMKSQLIRMPLMGAVVGVPWWLAILSQLDVYVPGLLMGAALAFGVHKSG